MKTVRIKDLKVGTFFVKKNAAIDTDECVRESAVYIRGEYDRSSKKYSCIKYVNSCHETFMNGKTEVIIDFYF